MSDKSRRALLGELCHDLKNWGTLVGLGVGAYIDYTLFRDDHPSVVLAIVAGVMLVLCGLIGGIIIAGHRMGISRRKKEEKKDA